MTILDKIVDCKLDEIQQAKADAVRKTQGHSVFLSAYEVLLRV